MPKVNIVILEDDEGVNRLLQRCFERESLKTESYYRGRDFLANLSAIDTDLLIIDYSLGDMVAAEVLDEMERQGVQIPFVVATGAGSEHVAVEMMKRGAREYFVKGPDFIRSAIVAIKRLLRDLGVEAELEKAKQDLALKHSILNAVHELSLDGVLVISNDDQVLSINARFSEIWGLAEQVDSLSAHEVFYLIAEKLVDKTQFLTSVVNLDSTLEPATVKHNDLHLQTGETIELFTAPMSLDDGEQLGRVWYFRDITLMEEAHKATQLARVGAEKNAKNRAEFLAHFSHEVRTPINSLQGFLELFSRTDLDLQQLEYLQNLSQSCQHLTSLINNTLEISRMEANAVEIRVELVELNSLLDEMRLLMKSDKEEVELRFRALEEAKVVYLDPLRMRQILTNLLANALKFTEKGYVELSITQLSSNRYRFAVTDTGAGIVPEKQAEIFEAFRQQDSSTYASHGGTGLGLAISAQLVRQMNSEIRVESQLGQGSVFYFELELESL